MPDSTIARRQAAHEQPSRPGRENYHVAVSSRRTSSGNVPTLKVTRLSDARVIYPFQGHADMPFFTSAQDAEEFAQEYGLKLVDGDIAVPE
ncbi:MAG: DUF6723 family protein [Paraburkholderia sp.]|uniref:DUF6723 family protein n=1 Tax=Paraburkholderia sp. TaxID=1926495 RepID=UPI003C5C19FD